MDCVDGLSGIKWRWVFFTIRVGFDGRCIRPCFNFLSICHIIQLEFNIVFSSYQFSMLFNGKHAFFAFSLIFHVIQ